MDLDKLVMLCYDSRIVIGKYEYGNKDSVTLSNSLHISKKIPIKKSQQDKRPNLPVVHWNDTVIDVRKGYKYSASAFKTTYNMTGAKRYDSLTEIQSYLKKNGFGSLAKELK